MPTTNFPEYAHFITDTLNTVVATGQASLVNLQIDQRSMLRGFISGRLLFDDNSELHFREFVDLALSEPRLMYAYHYQDANKGLLFRYDNAPHRPALSQVERSEIPCNGAEHKHTPAGITLSLPPTLVQIMDRILKVE